MAKTDGWNPTAHLPAGRILDRATSEALYAAWAAVGYEDMSDAAIEAIVGAPLDPVVMKREFGTGEYPVKHGERYTKQHRFR